MRYPLMIAFAVLLATGQILFKKAALLGVGRALPWGLVNGWLVAALVVYGGATLLWVWILRTTPLSIAYPFAALGFVIVPLVARFLFGEVLDLRYALGVAMIVFGVLLTSGRAGL